ncbi:hypothetical protein OAP08_02490 [Akkermansiaceae bacterium]|nr:hypothetical protein [Akkermansiaceae bacterium]
MSSDISIRIIGSKLPLYHLIGLYWFCIYDIKAPNILKYLRYELLMSLVLGLYFSFISPWDDVFASERQWNQAAVGRSITALIKISLNIVLTIGLYKFLKTHKVTIGLLKKTLFLVLTICVIIGLIDMVSGHMLRSIILEPVTLVQLQNRFIGLAHEPKAFGRGLGCSLLLMLAVFFHTRYKVRKITIYFIIFAIIVSSSASTFIALCGSLLASAFFFRGKLLKKVSVILFLLIGLLFLAYPIIKNNVTLQNAGTKVVTVFQGNQERQMANELIFFTRMEVFDRAAINFFYNQPKFLVFGTGPNLISIPSSIYMDESARQVLGQFLVGGPAMGSMSLISRSGVTGFLIYVVFFIRLGILLNKTRYQVYSHFILVSFFIFYCFNQNPFLFLAIAHVLAIAKKSKKIKRS